MAQLWGREDSQISDLMNGASSSGAELSKKLS